MKPQNVLNGVVQSKEYTLEYIVGFDFKVFDPRLTVDGVYQQW